jgi:hypothetical protein
MSRGEEVQMLLTAQIVGYQEVLEPALRRAWMTQGV